MRRLAEWFGTGLPFWGAACVAGPRSSRLRRPEPPSGSRPIRVTIAGASALRAVGPLLTAALGTPAADGYHGSMDLARIDETVLALLYLGIHERHRAIPGARTWKSHDWDALDRLHVRGLISDPATKAKSVLLTEDGLREAEAAFRRLFDPDG